MCNPESGARRIRPPQTIASRLTNLLWLLVTRPLIAVRKRLLPGRRRMILLFCNAPLMAKQLREFSDLFAGSDEYAFRVSFHRNGLSTESCSTMRGYLPFKQVPERLCKLWPWDLVVVADHYFTRLPGDRVTPVLYIGHGGQGKVAAGDDMVYDYGRNVIDDYGRVRYSAMFEARESDKRLAVTKKPFLESVIKVVGSVELDRLTANAVHREEYRKELNCEPGTPVVALLSTWGPDSLIQRYGQMLIEEALRLKGKYRFIFSVHPREYNPKPDGTASWGELLRGRKGEEFGVREPWEDAGKFLIASDIVISDHTSLVQLAVALEKPVLLIPVDEKLLGKGTVTWELSRFAPILRGNGPTEPLLEAAIRSYPLDHLRRLAGGMRSFPGSSAARRIQEVRRLLDLEES